MAKDFEALAQEAASDVGEDEFKARLLAALQVEEQNAIGYSTDAEITDHVDALNRYLGKPYGDEVDGRSKITTREIQETIGWLVPDLVDIFAAGGRICDLEAGAPEAEQGIEQRADYLNYVFFEDNQGVLILYDFIFDALLHKRSYMDVDWDDRPIYMGWQEYRGLTQLQVQGLLDDPATEVDPDSLEIEQVPPSEGFPDGQAYTVKARKALAEGKCTIECVPPEDMFVAGRSVEVRSSRYKGRLLRWRRAVWKRLFPDYADEIDEAPAGEPSDAIGTDERRAARFNDGDGTGGDWAEAAAKDAEELVGRKEYIWWSEFGDEGQTSEEKLLRVYRLGSLILEVEEVDDDPFASATGHRIPHRLQGLSIADLLGDLQKLKTVLTRSLVDGTMASNVPRIVAKEGVNLNDLLNLDHGAVIRSGQLNPSEAVMPLAMPDLAPSTLKALEWTNQIIEQRTGVSRHAQGLDPDSLNHTAKGIQLLQNAANGVKRMIARLIAVGVEEALTKVDRVIMRHQRQERTVRLGKEWARVNPTSWNPAMKVKVSVGLGTGSKEAQLQFLQMIQQDQVAWVSSYGPATPVVTPQHLYATVTEKLRVMGYSSPERYFGEPVQQNPQTGQMEPFIPQPPPSPDQQKIQAQVQEGQARLQLDQQKAQADAQLSAQKMQIDAQVRQMEGQAKAATDAQKGELDAAIARMKAEGELVVMREKAVLEADLKREQMRFEMQMALAQFEFEKEIAREKLTIQREQAEAKVSMNGSAGTSGPSFGGKPG